MCRRRTEGQGAGQRGRRFTGCQPGIGGGKGRVDLAGIAAGIVGGDGEGGRGDGAGRGLGDDGIVATVVAVIESIIGVDLKCAGIDAQHIFAVEALGEAAYGVACQQAVVGDDAVRDSSAVIDFAVSRSRQGEVSRSNGASSGLGGNGIVIAVIAVIEGIAGVDLKRAGIGAQHIFAVEALGETAYGVACQQAAVGDDAVRDICAVVDLAVGHGRQGEVSRSNGASSGLGGNGIVIAVIAVIEGIAGVDLKRAGIGAQHIFAVEALGETAYGVACQQAAVGDDAVRDGGAVVDFAVGRGRQRQSGRVDGDGAAGAGQSIIAVIQT
ncbi:hypothetical protein SAMN04490355_103224 [Pelosinus propionicus DSM 13327]|uniref:Uncharacterized protein n=1 Tax=Pelosinus propionicus DSM 13327 TaxID=1123291 RepID=A0A1I4MCC2_9FIRM|nr:hypothetical protein SAMN04490355_103224 [Pelosinus propionicus DSM 13327]